MEHFHDTMRDGMPPLYELFQELITYYQTKEKLSDNELIYVPFYKEWQENETWITEMIAQIKLNDHGKNIADYAFNGLSPVLLDASNSKGVVLEKIEETLSLLDRLNELLDEQEVPVKTQSVAAWRLEFNFAAKVSKIVAQNALGIFDTSTIAASNLDNLNRRIEKQRKLHLRLIEENENWTQKLNATDAKIAQEQWQRLDGSFFKFLNPNWYKIKGQLKTAYNFRLIILRLLWSPF
ncbi:superfamily I DNA and RNA helicases and helicase subunits [Nonlabens ulvanivorans]|nr:hypothetical protein [Nonlabens ulvanivorans]GAK92782.1 superfamily I DNA and RNA helicases and helicase subunits [Nonlabens ulvanivorans]